MQQPAAPPYWHPLPAAFRDIAAQKPGSVLLETAKFDAENTQSYLFLDSVRELAATNASEAAESLARIDASLAEGYYLAGFVSYDFGEVLAGMPLQASPLSPGLPLLRLGIFREPVRFDHRTGETTGPVYALPATTQAEVQTSSGLGLCTFATPEADYLRRVEAVQAYLAAGHSYQVNFTDRVTGSFSGSAIDLYRSRLNLQPVSFAAFLNLGESHILSFSPELFYRVKDRRLVTRPMKGTWPRGRNLQEDVLAAEALLRDGKNIAEHVTIVDLLRNDLGRICEMGSVAVDSFMQVERYNTLHQMTSTICGIVRRELSPSDIFAALFPCGSITGAPKRRTMEIIRETERQPRGVYTGAIGYFAPGGKACFNVAIRTAVCRGADLSLGVGGGVTVYSSPAEEYGECKLKAAFLTRSEQSFQLFETMRASGGTIPLLQAHLDRLRDSAGYFDFPFDEAAIRHELAVQLARSEGEHRFRLTLDQRGILSCENSALDTVPWHGRVLLWSITVDAADHFLQHKTSNRSFYEDALRKARQRGFDEVIFCNQSGCITEGAVSNIFVLSSGTLSTPHTSCGLLPGVRRAQVLRTRACVEAMALGRQELLQADAIWLTNALRGDRLVTALMDEDGALLWQQKYEQEKPALAPH